MKSGKCAGEMKLVPHKAKNDVLFLLEHGKWQAVEEFIARVGSMLEGALD